MQIAQLFLTNEKAPTNGYAIYIVCDETDRMIKVLHPVTMTAFDITHAEYRAADVRELWPTPYDLQPHGQKAKYDGDGNQLQPYIPINEQVCRMMEKNIRDGKPYTSMLVRRIFASLREIDLSDVPLFKGTNEGTRAPRGFAIRSEGRPGIIDAIDEMLGRKGGASMEEIITELIDLFPDRAPEGMKTTIRCQINRLPGKKAMKLLSRFENERGKVYEWEAK